MKAGWRTHDRASEIGAFGHMTPGHVRGRLIVLKSPRLISGHYDTSTPPRRVYVVTGEGRRKAEISDARGRA